MGLQQFLNATREDILHVAPSDIELPNLDITTIQLANHPERSFDDLIDNKRRRIEILEEMARLLYREWFVHFRYPGHADRRVKSTPTSAQSQRGWTVQSCLGEVLELS